MSSTIFMPTFLYIKQHLITGKLYFGKTTQDPEKYSGSGIYWTRHIAKHGKQHVINLWYCLYHDKQECTNFAISFSKTNNIVESRDWANYTIENGIDGFASGNDHPMKNPLVREKLSKSVKGVPKAPRTKEHNEHISQSIKNLQRDPEACAISNAKRSYSMLGNTNSTGPRNLVAEYHTNRPKLECPHCGKITAINIAKSKHFDKCKYRSTN